jgi:hypothetical protein
VPCLSRNLKHKPHPHHKERKDGHSDDSDQYDYCVATGKQSGEPCGDMGLFDDSFCYVDIEGRPACYASVWCWNLVLACTSTDDCPRETVCGNLCGNGFFCNPKCGNDDLPWNPLLTSASYYDDTLQSCYDESFVPMDSPADLRRPVNGTTYAAVLEKMNLMQKSNEKNKLVFNHNDLNISLVLVCFAILLSVAISSIFLRRKPLNPEAEEYDQLPLSSMKNGALHARVVFEPIHSNKCACSTPISL